MACIIDCNGVAIDLTKNKSNRYCDGGCVATAQQSPPTAPAELRATGGAGPFHRPISFGLVGRL
jgi:hypothetical protein